MKTLLKITALLLALIMMLGAITACNSASSETTESTDTESKSSTDAQATDKADLSLFPENAFPIFDGKIYAAKVVTSDTASSTERQVAASLRTELKSLTKQTLSASTDFLSPDDSYNSSAYEILIGETKHEEAKQVFTSLAFNSYGIKVVKNKMIFFFSSADEGKELVSLFMAAIKSTDKGALWVPSSITVGKNTSIHFNDVPKYPAQSLATVDCADDTAMIVASNTTLAKFNEYCATLVASGYTEYSKRDNVGETHFRTYTKGTKALTVYFSNGTKQARIIAGPLKDIPSKKYRPIPRHS